MSKVIETGPYFTMEKRACDHTYSESRGLSRIEWEMKTFGHFDFSFRSHLKRMKKLFPDLHGFNILDSGCGEGHALQDFVALGKELKIKINTTGITMDLKHREPLIEKGIDKVVIGTAENFFQQERRTNYYHFILDYFGALIGLPHDYPKDPNQIAAIYTQILTLRGSALLVSKSVSPLALQQDNGLIIEYMNLQKSRIFLVSKHPVDSSQTIGTASSLPAFEVARI